MNALRNITTRTLTYLLQNGQSALFNVTQPAVDGSDINTTTPTPTVNSNATKRPQQPLLIPKSILDATTFTGKKFDATNSGSISPSTLKRYRRIERKVELVYRCKLCNTRNSKMVSEAAYNSGVVILQCDGCAVNHLIRDNLGWFANTNGKSFDQVLAERSNSRVQVIKVNEHGDFI